MAIVFAVACVFLSRWQFTRNNETVVAANLLNHNYAAPAVPLAKLLPTRTAYAANEAWREVTVKGRYEPTKQLLVRDRSNGGLPGFEVLMPFRLSDGSVFVIDRGFVPVGTNQDRPDVVPAPPSGTVVATARLQASEILIPGRVAPSGEISEINLPKVERLTGVSVYTGAYGLLMTETPAPATRPVKAIKPTIDNGPFLSYAFQWILFAILGFGGLFWALRQEYRVQNADDPAERVRAASREAKARARPRSDAEIEDAQIEDALIVGNSPVAATTSVAPQQRARPSEAVPEPAAPETAPTEPAPPESASLESAEHPILHLN
jgi:cytochrome oxidase assembly protein ShyY1